MDDEDNDTDTQKPTVATVNTRYAAFSTADGVSVRTLHNDGQQTRHTLRGVNPFQPEPVLALSSAQLNRLAISIRDQTIICDAETGAQTHHIIGIGRTLTSLAWSCHDANVLAFGTIDGTICIWSLGRALRPLHRLESGRIPCDNITFSPLDPQVLASSYGGTVAIWCLRRSHQPIRAISAGSHRVTALSWHPTIAGRLLTVADDGVLRVWDVSESLSAVTPAFADHPESEDEDFFGELEGLSTSTHPIAQIQLGEDVANADWIGEHGTFALLSSSDSVVFYSYGTDWEMPHEVWKLQLDHGADRAHVSSMSGATMLDAVSKDNMASYRIPSAVLDSVGGYAQAPRPFITSQVQDFASKATAKPTNPNNQATDGDLRPSMTPISIAHRRSQRTSFSRTSKQIQQRRRTDSQKSRQTAITATRDSAPSPVASPSRAMISSLELPKPNGEDDDSPMPFLSPSIPVRKPSPSAIPPIDESLHLPPLRHASLESMPSTATNDSDSDDETFADGMHGSGTFMPGGVNVPLPKACGALFAPNGQLLIFCPPKPRLPTTPEKDVADESEREHNANATKVARLFSTFGNLATDSKAMDDDSDSNSSDSSRFGLIERLPTSSAQPSSFNSQHAWISRASPTKPSFGTIPDEHQIIITVHGVEPLLPSRYVAADGYRVLLENGESGTDLCRHNALTAATAGLVDAADVWRLMAMLFDERVPLQVLASINGEEDTLVVARRATSILKDNSSISLSDRAGDDRLSGRLRWADHPLARECLVRRVLGWADKHADVQMLACVAAVLAETEQRAPTKYPTAQDTMLAKLPMHSFDYSTHEDAERASLPRARPIPVLRTDSNSLGIVYGSPTKLRQSSQASSRNASQASTPHLESASSTPPLSLPTFSRQGSKLSTSGSGSASPEHHRSSFSAAAKYYAQSITDKFASYGTSPPTKKLGSSPSYNGLSTSLPMAGGSWSKSVSFASTASTARDSQLSRSYTDDEDGYDSDKTIEDSSLPHTPKSTAGPAIVHLPNKDAFADEIAGCRRMALLPQDLAVEASLWRQYYAEQLRCWGLWMQATELEKVSGLMAQSSSLVKPPSPHEGIVPARMPGQRKATCSICFAVIAKLEQVCPACLHTTHLQCLEEYLASLEGEDFECPTGCGCACAALPSEPVEVLADDTDTATAMKAVVRRSSFTDPRRWRARLEGDSW